MQSGGKIPVSLTESGKGGQTLGAGMGFFLFIQPISGVSAAFSDKLKKIHALASD